MIYEHLELALVLAYKSVSFTYLGPNTKKLWLHTHTYTHTHNTLIMTYIGTRSGQGSMERTMDSIFNNLVVLDFLNLIKVFVYNSKGFKRLWGPILNEVMRKSSVG